jgi:biotin carboxylase
MRRDRLLVIGGAASRELMDAATRRRLELVILTTPKIVAAATVSAPVIAVEALDYEQPLTAIVGDIAAAARRHEVGGIVPVMEFGLLPAALAASKLGLPAQSLKAVRNTRDKVHMRKLLDAAGMHQIEYAGCRTIDEARAFLARAGAPIIVKPVSGTGSDGVALVRDASELEAAWLLATGAVAFSGVVCESYIDGPEVSVEGYCQGGTFVPVAITDKMTNESFLEIGHSQPSRMPEEEQKIVFDYTGRVLAALGVVDGWTHTEVRVGPGGPVIIETHTRPGGDSIDLLTRHTSGVSTYEVMFDFALGLVPAYRPQVTGEAAVVRVLLGEPRVIAAIHIPPLPPSIAYLHVDAKVGDLVSARSASGNRLGYLVGYGRDVREATANAESFRDRIELRYEGDQQWITPAA